MRNLRGYKGKINGEQAKTLKDMGVSEEKVEHYTSMSEDELISELLSSVKKQKANGTFNPQQLETLVTMVSPRLSVEQQRKLNDLVLLLKNSQ